LSALRLWLIPGISALAFLAVWISGSNESLFLLLNRIGPATSDLLWANVTLIGDGTVGFALCLCLWRRRPDLLWAAVFVALLGSAWVHALKPLLEIPRPPAVLGDAVHVIGRAYKADSFPSGHATTAFAIGGLLFLGIRSTFSRTLVLLIAILASLSRAVVGVHWPLDILAGAFGGWLAAILAMFLSRKTEKLGLRPALQWLLALLTGACALALLLGHPDDYPQAIVLERLIGLACLASAAEASWRSRRG
jgi:membrane-associated phospholipid phosphatase